MWSWSLLMVLVMEVHDGEGKAKKWQINKHPKSFVRKLRILCGRSVLIDDIFEWFSSKGMHRRHSMWRIGAWSAVKSDRNDQVTEMDTRRPEKLLNSALLYIRHSLVRWLLLMGSRCFHVRLSARLLFICSFAERKSFLLLLFFCHVKNCWIHWKWNLAWRLHKRVAIKQLQSD